MIFWNFFKNRRIRKRSVFFPHFSRIFSMPSPENPALPPSAIRDFQMYGRSASRNELLEARRPYRDRYLNDHVSTRFLKLLALRSLLQNEQKMRPPSPVWVGPYRGRCNIGAIEFIIPFFILNDFDAHLRVFF